MSSKSIENIIKNLNPEQLAGVKHTRGPLLISAGAGSGKTRVLTHRIAYMIKHDHVPPYQILAMTFTNNAAKEMKDRIIKLCGPLGKKVWASTFHAFGEFVLRKYIDKLGYSRKFDVAGENTPVTVDRHILKHLNVSKHLVSAWTAATQISLLKNNLVTPSIYLENAEEANDRFKIIIGKVYKDYQFIMHQNECIDFDDMLLMTAILFENYPNILAEYQNRFRYISVDEYQDTNKAQYRIVQLLAEKYHNVCVVGDADQSIYGWRGANPKNLVAFKSDNPSVKTIRMNHNYRSTKNILKAANSVISRNHFTAPEGATASERYNAISKQMENKDDKKLWTDRPAGTKPIVFQAQDGDQEARYVAKEIKQEVSAHKINYHDIAVLYRSNAQSNALENAMVQSDIPYSIVGSIKFYARKEIKVIIDYLSLASNQKNEFAFRKIVNFPHRGIGKTTLRRLTEYADKHKENVMDAIPKITPKNSKLNKAACSKLNRFHEMIQFIAKYSTKHTITETVNQVLKETKYLHILKEQSRHSLTAKDRIDNIAEFKSVTTKFDHKAQSVNVLPDFIGYIMLRLNQNPNKSGSKDTVKLMTIHASKGQEYKHVFLTGLEQNIFPTYHSLFSSNGVREERRLAYVAITRAKDELTLTYATRRLLYGHVHENEESMFLDEIRPDNLVYRKGQATRPHNRPTHFDNQVFNRFF